MSEDLMTSHELARYLKVDLRTVYRYLKQGQVPAVKVGGRWRFRRKIIEAWVAGDRDPKGPSYGLAKRILIVNDSPQGVAALTEILQEAGYHVRSASSGEGALAMLREISYDLVIVDFDVQNPGALSLIARAHTLYAGAPKCIVITGHASREIALRALDLRGHRVLEKPLSAQQLLTTVEAALKG